MACVAMDIAALVKTAEIQNLHAWMDRTLAITLLSVDLSACMLTALTDRRMHTVDHHKICL